MPADEEPHLGQAWSELTAVGVRPHLVVTEFVPFRAWAESGTWRGVRADLRARLDDRAGLGEKVRSGDHPRPGAGNS